MAICNRKKVKFKNDKEIDFILMGNHGIFSKVENEDLIKGIWSTFDYNESLGKNVNEQGGICADMALKLAKIMFQQLLLDLIILKDSINPIVVSFISMRKQLKNNIKCIYIFSINSLTILFSYIVAISYYSN